MDYKSGMATIMLKLTSKQNLGIKNLFQYWHINSAFKIGLNSFCGQVFFRYIILENNYWQQFWLIF